MIDGRAEGFTVVGLKEGRAEISSSVVYEVRRLSHKSQIFTIYLSLKNRLANK